MFGFWAIVNILRTDFFKIFDISTTDADKIDCFIDFGAHSVCDATLLISIQSSLFLLVAQALVSRVLTPGISIFVNSSVSSVKRRQLRMLYVSVPGAMNGISNFAGFGSQFDPCDTCSGFPCRRSSANRSPRCWQRRPYNCFATRPRNVTTFESQKSMLFFQVLAASSHLIKKVL